MPWVHWDTQKSRAQYQRRFPPDVADITGQWFRHKYPGDVSLRTAIDLSVEQTLEFNARVDAARRQAGTPEAYVRQTLRRLAAKMIDDPAFGHLFATGMIPGSKINAVLDDPAATAKLTTIAHEIWPEQAPMPKALVEPRDPVLSETVIDLWIKDRKRKPKPKAIRARGAKMDEFFDWLAKHHHCVRHTDMARVSGDDLQAYKEWLPADIARDHLIDVRAHFRVAAKNNKFPYGNPAVGLFLPARRRKARRVDFTDGERTLILSRARESDDPVIKWPNLIASVTGAGTGEIVDADTRDVEVVDGITVFHIRTDHRAYGDDDLKTEFRGRSLPVHPGVAADLLAYRDAVRQGYYDGGDGPLFPQIAPDRDGVRNHRASMRIMRFLRRIGIRNEPGIKRDFYSWRHTVTTQLEALTTPDRARYVVGHGGRDVHARDYLKHPVPELLRVIARLPNPMEGQPGGGCQ